MRLDKFLCFTKNLSRKDAKEAVKKKRILVNGAVVSDPGLVIKEGTDVVTYDGEQLIYEEFVYYMLNKPAGVVSATKDNVSKTVIDLIDTERENLFPVGRLDKDTVGFLIITDDGALSHHLTSPRHHIDKTYFVRSKSALSKEDFERIEKGIELEDGVITKPGHIEKVSDKEYLLTISEGMFHEVKRIFFALDNEVLYLKRIKIGNVILDETLKEGEYRRLTEEELSELKGND